jgi:hypothetical protein
MNKAKLMFFVSCPACKKKFGIEPKYITMYLHRIIANYKERFKRISEMLEAAQTDVKKKIG